MRLKGFNLFHSVVIEDADGQVIRAAHNPLLASYEF
jgi:hypothetical protein